MKRQLDAGGPNCKLYLTGHSKGGAMANLAAMRVHAERGVKAEVYTYAASHPGNEDFADAYDAQIESTRPPAV